VTTQDHHAVVTARLGTGQACEVCGKGTPYTDWPRCEEHNGGRDIAAALSGERRRVIGIERDTKESGHA